MSPRIRSRRTCSWLGPAKSPRRSRCPSKNPPRNKRKYGTAHLRPRARQRHAHSPHVSFLRCRTSVYLVPSNSSKNPDRYRGFGCLRPSGVTPCTRSPMSPRTKVRADVGKKVERASPEFSQNDILSRLDSAELSALMEHAEEVSFPIKQRLFDSGDTIEHVYFPLTGMVSLVIVLADGPTIEAMTVGKEGFVGLPLLNDVSTARYRGVCQIEGRFLVLSAKTFIPLIDALPKLTRRLRRYSQFA